MKPLRLQLRSLPSLVPFVLRLRSLRRSFTSGSFLTYFLSFFLFLSPQKRFRVAVSFCMRTSLCLETPSASSLRNPPSLRPPPSKPLRSFKSGSFLASFFFSFLSPKKRFRGAVCFLYGQAFAWKDVRDFCLQFFVFKQQKRFRVAFSFHFYFPAFFFLFRFLRQKTSPGFFFRKTSGSVFFSFFHF